MVRQGETLRIPAAQALAEEGLLPADLQPKEGLSLMNGTQMTTAMAVSVWSEAKNLLETANLATALSPWCQGIPIRVARGAIDCPRPPRNLWSVGG